MGLPSEIITGLIGSSGYSGYQIDQSMVFDGSSDYLSRTPGSAGNRQILTISTFFKWNPSKRKLILVAGSNGSNYGYIEIGDAGSYGRGLGVGDATGGSFNWLKRSTPLFRDPSSWYHLVVAIDTTEGAAEDRCKVWINNVRVTDWVLNTNPSLNYNNNFNNTVAHYIGRDPFNSTYSDGYKADFHLIDGTSLTPTSFGEFYNGTTAWRAIEPSGLTYGTNGFYLPFTQDTPNLGTDYSGNGNDWTENGSPVQSSDSPTVNYATLNPLNFGAYGVLSNGSRSVYGTGAGYPYSATTIAANSGKYYAEVHIDTIGVGEIGIVELGGDRDVNGLNTSGRMTTHGDTSCIAVTVSGMDIIKQDGDNTEDSVETNAETVTTNDVVGIAWNLDDMEFIVYKNGTQVGSINTIPNPVSTNAFWALMIRGHHYFDYTVRFDEGEWEYTPPTDHVALSAANLPDPTITDGSNNFKTTTWTGYTPTLYEQTRISSSTTINNSMVLDGSTDYLSWTPAGAGTDSTRFSFSCFLKFCEFDRAQSFFSAGPSNTNRTDIAIELSNKIQFTQRVSSTTVSNVSTNAVFRDPGSWYHVVVIYNSNEASSSDRIKIIVNGVEQTLTHTDAIDSARAVHFAAANEHAFGLRVGTPSQYFNGYIADPRYLDGQVGSATDFGEFNSDNIWSPKAVSGLTYGTNGFFLPFTQDTPNLGVDYSGNGNDWTENGSPVQSSDSPTVNYATLNPFIGRTSATYVFSNGNRSLTLSSGSISAISAATIATSTLPFYFECVLDGTGNDEAIGICDISRDFQLGSGPAGAGLWMWDNGGVYREDTTSTGSKTTYTTNDRIGVAVDPITGKIWLRKNGGSWEDSGDPVAGTNASMTFPAGLAVSPACSGYSGVDYTFAFADDDLTYSPPTGYQTLAAANLPAISDSDLYFNGGSADLVWIKSRSAATSHKLIDTVRGVGLNLSSDSTAAETGEATVNRIDKYGIHLGDDADVNNAASTYVAWLWKAGGAGVVNTDGTISSTVSVNDDAGFSIVSWTLGSTDNQTVGHGLSAAPEFMFLKNRDTAGGWTTYHKDNTSAPETDYLRLHSDGATVDNVVAWNDTAPTNSVFTIGDVSWFGSASDEMIMYCFRSIPGYSKVGSLELNNSTDGTFISLGFKPAFFLMKRTASGHWGIWDDIRNPFNVSGTMLRPNTNNPDLTGYDIDILSNGVKIRDNHAQMSSGTAIFYAVARHPFGGSNLPLGLAQ